MTTINLITKINASKKVVFDLSRNIDVHQTSASKTNEKAIDGVTFGLINFSSYLLNYYYLIPSIVFMTYQSFE